MTAARHALLTERDLILSFGCNACIPKPIDFDVLRRSLDRWLPPLSVSNPAS